MNSNLQIANLTAIISHILHIPSEYYNNICISKLNYELHDDGYIELIH